MERDQFILIPTKKKKDIPASTSKTNIEINEFKMNSIMHASNRQIIPKHNKYNEQCNMEENREYEVSLPKKYFLIYFSWSRETSKFPLYAYNWWGKKPRSDKNMRKGK